MNTYNQNNQYGDNIMNFGHQPRKLDVQAQEQLKKIIKSGSSVRITSVLGDGEAYNFANEIKNYLQGEGYTVDGVDQAVYTGPVAGQSIQAPRGDNDRYEIVIGNR